MAADPPHPRRVVEPSLPSLLSRLATAHFIWNFAALAAAVAAAQAVNPQDSLSVERHAALLRSQLMLLAVALGAALYKMVGRGMTAEAALDSFLVQAQATVLLLSWPIQPPVSAWMAVIFVLIHILLPTTEPRVEGAAAALEELTQRQFDALIAAPDNNSNAQVLVLYSGTSAACHQHHVTLASLAKRFSGPALKWGRLDVTRFPDIGERYSVNSTSSPSAVSLPAVLLFQGGVSVARLSAQPPPGSLLAGLAGAGAYRFTEKYITEALQLDSWLVRNRKRQ